MERQLIVVVHGVGVRDAGVVTAQLSAALCSTAGPEQAEAARWHPHSTDDFMLHEWINVFRVDDFVGTHIDRKTPMTKGEPGMGWPAEFPVAVNGHTNYWVDSNVMPRLQAVLRFDADGR